jgi:hypothetical protein
VAKYPISVHSGKVSKAFLDILTFHVPPTGDKSIFDPTCGYKHLWNEFHITNMEGKTLLESFGKVTFSDIKDCGQEHIADIFKLKVNSPADAIVYDPPYFFGVEISNDKREDEYGGYAQTYEELLEYMDVANNRMYSWLKDNGKLIVKCSDQYNVKERKFYAHHITFYNRLSNYKLIDIFIYQHHNISPTAFQVKNRPTSVIMHTYFLIFKKRGY